MPRGLTRAELVRNRRRGDAAYEKCCELWRLAGADTVYRLSQGRRTRQTPGLPDLIVAVRLDSRTLAASTFLHGTVVVAHEVKSGGAQLTPEQRRFRAQWEASGNLYVLGDDTAIYPVLVELGRARPCATSPTGYILQPGGPPP